MKTPYEPEPTQDAVAKLQGPAVLEFGANWCGYCKAAEPLIESAFAGRERVRHIKIEDGKGRPLGRSFRVKLWPTLIFLRDGVEVARVVRPTDASEVGEALAKIA
jgi:thioredoxin 1